jgi:hypothetical protein
MCGGGSGFLRTAVLSFPIILLLVFWLGITSPTGIVCLMVLINYIIKE